VKGEQLFWGGGGERDQQPGRIFPKFKLYADEIILKRLFFSKSGVIL